MDTPSVGQRLGRWPRLARVLRTPWAFGRRLHHDLPGPGPGDPERGPASAGASETAAVDPATSRVPAGSTLPTSLSPDPRVANPVLAAGDVADFGPAMFVPASGDWHLFFEVYDGFRTPDSAIAHATSDDRGCTWAYDRVVLDPGYHVSFPYVFAWEGDHYMIPEDGRPPGTATVGLYRATSFPTGWKRVADPVAPDHGVDDAVAFRWDGRWWMVVGDQWGARGLHVYASDDLETDGWRPHECNPVVRDRPAAVRPAGRPVVTDGFVLAFFQDTVRQYGDGVRAYRITDLSVDAYEEEEVAASPVLTGSGRRLGWNTGGMHHVDPWYVDGTWRCAVDGNVGLGRPLIGRDHWSIGLYAADDG